MSGMMQLCQETARTRSSSARGNKRTSPSSPPKSAAASRRGSLTQNSQTQQSQRAQQKQRGPAAGPDGLARCPWSTSFAGGGSEAYTRYHDEEWGRPLRDDVALLELLVLEGAQAGLSWSTILAKREAYRAAFSGFDPVRMAALGDEDVERLMSADSGIVRHPGKIMSAIKNARCVLQIQEQHGSFSDWVWAFVPGGQPIVNKWREQSQVPTRSQESEHMSAEMKKAGFAFVGPVTCYSFMQAAGLVNDHLVGCFCHPDTPARPATPQ